MKIMLCTTPIRMEPTDFPPFGSLGLIKYLRDRGIEVEFYHIDANRPDYDEVLRHIEASRPDVLGISAVVSTAYAYTKRLALDAKRLKPDTLVVVGGSLAASAEILLRRAGVDLCVLGEGERIFHDVCRRAETTRDPADFADIPGLALLDRAGALVNTGYAQPLTAAEVYDIDWSDLERASGLGRYIYDAFNADGELRVSWAKRDPRAFQPHRRSKKVGSLVCSKGCVARCTFCHRWDKGIRYIPVEVLRGRIEELIEKHDVGFFTFSDENFGTDRRWLKQFCELVKGYDILWSVGGMRTNCVDPERLAMMRDAGCCYITFGFESGSARMLEVMEKKTRIEDNYNAARWVIEAGLNTVLTIVLGMPGESNETVRETAAFLRFALTQQPWQSPYDVSITHAQALPGTPLYEYARRNGMIGTDLDGEEAYLIQISDRDAADATTTLNFTDQPADLAGVWRVYLIHEVRKAFAEKYGHALYHQKAIEGSGRFEKRRTPSGYFSDPQRSMETGALARNILEAKREMGLEYENNVPSLAQILDAQRYDLMQICYPVEFDRLMALNNMDTVADMIERRAVPPGPFDHRSLRKVVWQEIGAIANDTPAMQPLRQGR